MTWGGVIYLNTKWKVAHAHYEGEPPQRTDSDASFDEENKAYKCPKCNKAVAGIEAGVGERLYVLSGDVVVGVE